MVRSNVKSLFIILLAIIIIVSISKSSFAANDDGLAGLLLDENATLGDTDDLGDEETTNEENTPVLNVPTVNNVQQNTPANNQQSTLPQAGESDVYVVAVLIVVFAIVTIYAYKKIRDYNEL